MWSMDKQTYTGVHAPDFFTDEVHDQKETADLDVQRKVRMRAMAERRSSTKNPED